MKRKAALLLAGMLVCSATLAGCSGGNQASNDYVTVGGYKGIEVDKVEDQEEVTDEDIDNYIASVQQQNAQEVTDRPVQEGDIANIDFVGKMDGQEFEKEEESEMKNTKYELIVVIANHGYSEEVMDAARKEGAGGGTVIHARGTGLERAEKFLGVSIADEKEMIFIVAKTESKNAIMKSIMENAGLNSRAKAVTFSIPVTDTAGLRLQEIQ